MDLAFFDSDRIEVTLRLGAALAVGGIIGIERSYHGRPAGFRTHALVALSTALLMLVPLYGAGWFPATLREQLTFDPTRMAQGIMTGIGFLGAGTIMREGLTIRGLTTAASLWITAAIGILVGTGSYFPAGLAVLLTVGTLSLFRWVESRIPAKFHAHFTVRFQREANMRESELRTLMADHGFRMSNLHYRLDNEAGLFEYRMVIQAARASSARPLAESLSRLPAVRDFSISPSGD